MHYTFKNVIFRAGERLPSMIIDCANAADPHTLYPYVPLESMDQIFVVEVELLYKFRDVVKALPPFLHEKAIQRVLIITGHLFNYQDERENYYVLRHAWELIHKISREVEVLATVQPGSLHHKFAKWDIQQQANAG
ncbi:MAG: hypothetical protein ACQESG_07840 [Nanobdellota archaeon]